MVLLSLLVLAVYYLSLFLQRVICLNIITYYRFYVYTRARELYQTSHAPRTRQNYKKNNVAHRRRQFENATKRLDALYICNWHSALSVSRYGLLAQRVVNVRFPYINCAFVYYIEPTIRTRSSVSSHIFTPVNVKNHSSEPNKSSPTPQPHSARTQ